MGPEREIDTEAGPPAPFPTTLWTVVLEAGAASEPVRRGALEELIRSYWRPVYAFVRRRTNDREAAKDLTQGFFAAVLERDAFRGLEREGGKFRSFLLAALRNHLADASDQARALKRGGDRVRVPMDVERVERESAGLPPSSESPDVAFRKEWALSVIAQALAALRAEYAAEGRQREFEAFCRHLGYAEPRPSYAELAGTLEVSENDVRNRLHAARGRYAAAILRVLRASTRTEGEAEEELRDLFAAFG